jgi:hypothetical protein
MMDTCILLAYSAAQDDYGNASPTWTAGNPIACGLDPTAQSEVMQGTQVVVSDAELRLPIDTVVSNLDRVEITHRHGEELDTHQFVEVIGDPERGASGLVLKLRFATDGRD